MKNARQFVYQYKGDTNSKEVVEDLDGEIPVPEKGQVIERNGKRWKVANVVTQTTGTAIPVYLVFLDEH